MFVHEKKDNQILIDRNKIGTDLPVVVAEPEYGIFELLKVIENAKSVHVVSSCFLSLFMCKKYNENFFAHMYCDRAFITPYIQQHEINVILCYIIPYLFYNLIYDLLFYLFKINNIGIKNII